MIIIDGSKGGGQILRTSTALAALEEKEIKVKNIRGSRPSPGLKEQHLKGLRALSRACNGELKGDKKGSKRIELKPGKKINKGVEIKVETAGSVGLILQQFFILGMKNNLEVKIDGGGTYGKWAPPLDYLKNVFLPLMRSKGYRASININREGFYPKGGAKVKAEIKKTKKKLGKINITDKGEIKRITGISKSSKSLRKQKVADRQAKSAFKNIKGETDIESKINTKYVEVDCPGSGILLKAETNRTIIGADALGKKGKKSEEVGKEASNSLLKELIGEGTVDIHMADQLIPYMAYAPSGSIIKTRKITNHVKTNIKVVEKILPVKFKLKGKEIKTVETNYNR